MFTFGYLQRVRTVLRLWKPPASQEVMCYIVWVHVWVGTRSSGQHLPHQNTKGPLRQRGRGKSSQELSVTNISFVKVLFVLLEMFQLRDSLNSAFFHLSVRLLCDYNGPV